MRSGRLIVEKIVLGIFIISVIALLVLCFLAVKGRITGMVVDSGSVLIEQKEVSCKDSDNGEEFNLKGSVRYCNGECEIREDACIDDKRLQEFYCEGTNLGSAVQECANGCDEGVCLITPRNYAYKGGGSSSGGESTSSSVSSSETSRSYYLGELTSEQTLEIVKGDSIGFVLGGDEYTINLKDKGETNVLLAAGSQEISVGIGGVGQFNLDSNGADDIRVGVKAINLINGKVRLILLPLR